MDLCWWLRVPLAQRALCQRHKPSADRRLSKISACPSTYCWWPCLQAQHTSGRLPLRVLRRALLLNQDDRGCVDCAVELLGYAPERALRVISASREPGLRRFALVKRLKSSLLGLLHLEVAVLCVRSVCSVAVKQRLAPPFDSGIEFILRRQGLHLYLVRIALLLALLDWDSRL